MPWKTAKRKGELVNLTTSGPHAGHVHGHFRRTQAGHARAAGQIEIMKRAEKGKQRYRRRMPKG
jgi:riboflavin synthase alpha subunit